MAFGGNPYRYYRPRKRRRTGGRARRNVRTGGFTGIETKFYDTFLIPASLDTNVGGEDGEHNPSATIALSTITQGNGEQQRTGRRATWLSLNVTGVVRINSQTNATVADTACVVFIAIVCDKQTNGALLNSEDVYLNPSGNAALSCSLMRNLAQSKRFDVLAIRRLTMSAPNLTYDGTNIEQAGAMRSFRIFYRFKTPIVANYSGTTETIANSTDNSLHMLAWCNNVELAPSFSYNSRLRFRG